MAGNTLSKKISKFVQTMFNGLGLRIKPAEYLDHRKILNLERQLFFKEAVSRQNLMEFPTFIMTKWGKYIGHYVYFVKNNESYLYSLAMEKAYENAFHQQMLVEHFMGLNKDRKCSTHIPSTNKSLIMVLENKNFKIVKIDNKYYSNGCSAVFMCKNNERKLYG